MILPILLVVLAGMISLAAALSAFIVSRSCSRSAFRALCYAAATFTAALTLTLLALTFVENAVQDHYMRSHGSHSMSPAMIVDRDGDGRPIGFREAYAHTTGYVSPQKHCRDQRDSQALREGGISGMATGQQPEGGDPGRAAWADEQVTQLYRDHYSRCYRLVRKNGFNEADADDILNICGAATYLRLVQKGPVQGNLVAYFTGAVNHQMAQFRRNRLRAPADPLRDETQAARQADLAQTPSLSQEQRAQLKAGLSALDELPRYLKEPYELSVYGGLKPAEIAGMLGMLPDTIRAHLSVARAFVKKRVAELLQPGVGGREEDDE